MAILRLPRLPQLPAALQTARCDPATLYRISGHATGEPYFGRANTYRFDDPHPQAATRFGTCYLGSSLAVALAETLLHDRKPIHNRFVIELAVIRARFVIRLTGETLILADLTGAALRKLGGHGGLSGTSSYQTTKTWSAAIHAHPDTVDGMLYMSRHKNDETALVLFHRAASKLAMVSATPLSVHPDFGQAATLLGIRSAWS
ncbi:RES family NAD+ phosphorylase [Janthinobacterium sp. SUN211]|uniref:RES family NAD+ phosphorylase n=1 Tax=Janthinobacterium sp. SUN211 TaxID=3014786 RepID=UPI0027132F2C|nr:RES family NAD+ phosphorylase [Janthinobacterium sp. SUN211]MDO8048873.1 RES family NAD+ phosphorylase [Janthinobacterium sp. SUN211]